MSPHIPLSDITRLSPEASAVLKKMKIVTALDLLSYFPIRYGDSTESITINQLTDGMKATIFGRISTTKTKKAFRSKVPMAEATISDDTGSIKALWFHQAYMAKLYPEGTVVKVEGVFKANSKSSANTFSIVNPHIESVAQVPEGIGDSLFGRGSDHQVLYPVYPEKRGITSNWIYHTVQKIFRLEFFEQLIDPLPEEILKRYNLPSRKTALIWIHAPQKADDATSARKRFAFEEIFLIQLKKQQERKQIFDLAPFAIKPEKKLIDSFTSRFPFELTAGQKKAIDEILQDFASGHPMSRLLEGDVGSGKTAVAATTAYAVTASGMQTAYMVPTEILAIQHFESFIKFFAHIPRETATPLQIGLITSSGCRKFPSKVNPQSWTDISRSQLLKWVADGSIPILIGTHSLIQKSVIFKRLAYIVIDEQHRFGTAQRQKLSRKNADASHMPHLLSMTATPIPRTLSLTFYGDLDLTILSEMPSGRKLVETEILLPKDRARAYECMRREINTGRQAYVICPRIDEPDEAEAVTKNARSVMEEVKRLAKDVFPEFSLGHLHGKMTPKAKDAVMKQFEKNEIQILVSTSVVEVGVNVPNATIMLIEGGERFGLSQLHQLRGRIIRSNHQAYCFVISESESDKTVERLRAIKTAKNGFELAEYDLALRGTGSLSGEKQWGVSDVGMEAMKNLRLVEAARSEAKSLIERDPTLSSLPDLRDAVAEKKPLHFE